MPTIGNKCNARGFTMIELMITIVIVIILGALAVPAMTNLMIKHRVQDAATDMFGMLFKARSEALRRVAIVRVRPSDSGTDWTVGWSIFDNNAKVVDTHQATQRMTITTTPSALTAITYNSAGRITCSPACGVNEPKLVLTASNGGYSCSYTILVDPSGRPYETTSGRNATNKATGGGAPAC